MIVSCITVIIWYDCFLHFLRDIIVVYWKLFLDSKGFVGNVLLHINEVSAEVSWQKKFLYSLLALSFYSIWFIMCGMNRKIICFYFLHMLIHTYFNVVQHGQRGRGTTPNLTGQFQCIPAKIQVVPHFTAVIYTLCHALWQKNYT